MVLFDPVNVEVVNPRRSEPANFTRKRLLFAVNTSHVNLQESLGAQTFSTLRALERQIFSVRELLMLYHKVWSGKFISTDVTLIFFASRGMALDMSLQVTLHFELGTTDRTHMSSIFMSPYVTPQGAATFLKSFSTDVTRFPFCLLVVHKFNVTFQGCLVAVTLPTVGAYHVLELCFHQVFKLLQPGKLGMNCC